MRITCPRVGIWGYDFKVRKRRGKIQGKRVTMNEREKSEKNK